MVTALAVLLIQRLPSDKEGNRGRHSYTTRIQYLKPIHNCSMNQKMHRNCATVRPKEVIGEISKVIKKSENTNENVLTQDGSDGVRTRDLRLDRPTC